MLNDLKQTTEDLYNHFSNSQRTVRTFQDELTKISSFLCNREVQWANENRNRYNNFHLHYIRMLLMILKNY